MAKRLRELFDHAMSLQEAERTVWLRKSCRDDPELQDTILKLIEAANDERVSIQSTIELAQQRLLSDEDNSGKDDSIRLLTLTLWIRRLKDG